MAVDLLPMSNATFCENEPCFPPGGLSFLCQMDHVLDYISGKNRRSKICHFFFQIFCTQNEDLGL